MPLTRLSGSSVVSNAATELSRTLMHNKYTNNTSYHIKLYSCLNPRDWPGGLRPGTWGFAPQVDGGMGPRISRGARKLAQNLSYRKKIYIFTPVYACVCLCICIPFERNGEEEVGEGNGVGKRIPSQRKWPWTSFGCFNIP